MTPAITPSRQPLWRQDDTPVAWAVSSRPVEYAEAVAAMEARAAAVAEGSEGELVWLLEHPALYTAGVSARSADLLAPDFLPVHRSGRGGQYTYHGPGQRVAYVMLDLGARGRDVRAFVRGLETWIVAALAALGIEARTRAGRVGVWVDRAVETGPAPEAKIAAIGVRLRRWVSFHGVSLNVDPNLAHFAGIVPCGLAGFGVTSLADLGRRTTMDEADSVLRAAFEPVFGPTFERAAPVCP